MRRLLLAALLGVLATSGCSRDDPGPPIESVDLSALDNVFSPDRVTVAEGPIEFRVVNDGEVPHTFVLGQFGFKLKVFDSGQREEGVVEVEAGEYFYYCDIEGHREDGMEGLLRVDG